MIAKVQCYCMWLKEKACRCRRLGVLPRNWAHEIGSPERGCLLVARQPNMGSLYSHAVILILEHGEYGSQQLDISMSEFETTTIHGMLCVTF